MLAPAIVTPLSFANAQAPDQHIECMIIVLSLQHRCKTIVSCMRLHKSQSSIQSLRILTTHIQTLRCDGRVSIKMHRLPPPPTSPNLRLRLLVAYPAATLLKQSPCRPNTIPRTVGLQLLGMYSAHNWNCAKLNHQMAWSTTASCQQETIAWNATASCKQEAIAWSATASCKQEAIACHNEKP